MTPNPETAKQPEPAEGTEQALPSSGHAQQPTTACLLDTFLYAPLGLLLSENLDTTELAAQGRRHIEAARFLGRMALSYGPTIQKAQNRH